MYADTADWFREDYARTTPDGADHFDVVFDKVMTLWRNPLELPLAELARISAPTLVMQGDDDGVRTEYSTALARALPTRSSLSSPAPATARHSRSRTRQPDDP